MDMVCVCVIDADICVSRGHIYVIFGHMCIVGMRVRGVDMYVGIYIYM